MRILVIAAADATNLSIANVIEEFINRGHFVKVYAIINDYKTIRMFLSLGLEVEPVNNLNNKVVSEFDFAFCGTDAMHILRWYDIFIFNYNFIFTNSWPTEGSDFMFTICNKRKMRCYEDCATMPIGNPKNSRYVSAETDNKQILYVDAGHYPFGEKGKNQVAKMILDICNRFKDYKIVVKPRWLENDTNMTHRNDNHIYKIVRHLTDNDIPSNLVLLNQHIDLEDLIEESTTVVTTSYSVYLDAAVKNKGILIVGGFDCDDKFDLRTNVTTCEQTETARDTGCFVDWKDVTNNLPEGLKCSEKHLEKLIPYRSGSAQKIVDVVEFVHQEYLSKGKFPANKEYSYKNFRETMSADKSITFRELKKKRFRNSLLKETRCFDFVDADIDYSECYEVVNRIPNLLELNDAGYQDRVNELKSIWKHILISNRNKLMSDPLNQAMLLQAYYDCGEYEKIFNMKPDEILCEGPWNYYVARIYRNNKDFASSIYYFYLFLKKANARSYEKYNCELGWGIKIAYTSVIKTYDKVNLTAQQYAELYLDLYAKNNAKLIARNDLKKMHSTIPFIYEKLIEEGESDTALRCGSLYLKNQRTLGEIAEINNLKRQIANIHNSKSFRFAKLIAWFPNKVRNGAKCCKEHGLVYTVKLFFKKINNKFRSFMPESLIRIKTVYNDKVMLGYSIYERLIQKYGENSKLFLTAGARGDAYILGSLFRPYLKTNENVEKPIFIVWTDSSIEVAKLFDIDLVESVSTLNEFHSLVNLLMFDSNKIIKIKHLHFQTFYRHTGIFEFLMGLRDMNLFSLSAAALNVPEDSGERPVFNYEELELDELFKGNGLITNRTVLLTPYAKTVKAIPYKFWVELTKILKEKGFIVCTNVASDDEKPIPDTKAVYIPFRLTVPFLEKAGATIGVRSGFQDVINTADCMKISLIREPDRCLYRCCKQSEAFSLSKMFLQENQFDFLYTPETHDELIKKIVELTVEYIENKKDD